MHRPLQGSRIRDPYPRPGQAEVQGDVQLGRKTMEERKTKRGPLDEISSWWLNSRTCFSPHSVSLS